MGLRSWELAHRMDTVITREKLVDAECSRRAPYSGYDCLHTWGRVFSSCYCHSRNLGCHGGAHAGNHWALSIIPNTSEPTDQAMGASSHVQRWELDNKEDWTPKNWCFGIVVLEKTLEYALESKPVNPKRNQPLICTGRTDAKAEVPILWTHYANSWLIGKDPDAGKDWGQEEKGVTEDQMVEWHQDLNGHESEQTPGYSKGQGSLVCSSPWDSKELDMT